MPSVQMPDGKVVQFPDNMSKEEMSEASARYVQGSQQPAEPKTDWWRGVAQTTGSALGGLGALAAGQIPPATLAPEELVTVPLAMAAGDVAGGQAYDYVRGLMYPETMPTLPEAAERAAIDASLDIAGGAIGGKIVQGAGKLLSPIKSSLARRLGPTGATTAQDIAGLEAQGFRPEVGMLGSPEAQAMSSSMRGKPGTGSIFSEVDAANFARGQELSGEIADKLGPNMTPYDIGQLMRRDAIQSRQNWKGVNDELWAKVSDAVPDDVPILANSLKAVADNFKAQSMESELANKQLAPVIEQIDLVLKDIDQNGYAMKRTLQSIKKVAKGAYKKLSHEATDVDRALMQLERAADRDITDAARLSGGAEVEQAITNAKDWFKRGMGNKREGDVGLLDEVAEILKMQEPEAIYQKVIKGGKPAAERLMKTINMMSDETVSAMRSRAYRDMSRANPGAQNVEGDAFSFATLLTNYSKMEQKAPGMSKILFGPASKEMDKLLKNAEFFKSLDKYANVSQTGVNRAWEDLWGPIMSAGATGAAAGGLGGSSLAGAAKGAAVGAGLVGAKVATQRRIAKLMTDPDFVKWLVNSTRATAGGRISKPNIYGRLAAIGMQRAATPEQKQRQDNIIWYLGETGHDVTRITDQTGKTKKVEVQ